jgi:hypothetical protein
MRLQRIRKFIINLPIFKLDKRQRFVLVSFVLALFLFATQNVKVAEQRLLVIGLFGMMTYLLTVFALYEDLEGIEWVTLLVLPVLFSISVAFFVPLLPRSVDSISIFPLLPDEARAVAVFIKFGFWIFYAIGYYFLLLTENIYNVSGIRTIQLLRAAHAIGFLFTLVTAFLLFNVFFSLETNFVVIFFGVFLISFPLILQGLWTVNLEEGVTYSLGRYTTVLTLCISQVALMLSFWPIDPTMNALFLTAVLYELLGISQHYFSGRLVKRAVLEFAFVAGVIFLMMLTVTKWTG